MNIFFNHAEDRFRAGWRIAAQFFLMMIIGFGAIALLSLFFSISGEIISTLPIAAGAVISIYLAARGLDRRPWTAYGINLNKTWLRQCALGFVLAGAAMGFIFFIEYSAGWIELTGYGWQLGYGTYSWSFLGYFFFMVVVGFWEELVFRGYQIVNAGEGLNLPGVSRKQAVLGAVALSSLIFGLGHVFNPNAGWLSTINIVLAGVMLAVPFIVTGSLSWSIGLHIGWNFFQGGVFGFPVSGLPGKISLVQIRQGGPEWLTGGAFGPEAGLLGILGLILIIGGLFLFFRNKQQEVTIHPSLGIYMPSPRNYPA